MVRVPNMLELSRQRLVAAAALWLALSLYLALYLVPWGGKRGQLILGKKRIIYSCVRMGCGGWADRQKGIVGAYVLALLLNRHFRIRMTFPCALDLFLNPNEMEWRLSPEEEEEEAEAAAAGDTEHLEFLDSLGVQRLLRERLDQADLQQAFPAGVTELRWNMEVVQYLRQHNWTASAGRPLAWLRERSVPEVYDKVLRQLFTLRPRLRFIIEDMKDGLPPNVSLVCAQVRLGDQVGFQDGLQVNISDQLYLSFANNFLKKYCNATKYRIFITSDSAQLVSQAMTQCPAAVLPPLPGRITHIDKVVGAEACAGMGKVILDQYALATCDVLAISDSGLGKIASFMRGRDDQLFVLRLDSGRLQDVVAVARSTKIVTNW